MERKSKNSNQEAQRKKLRDFIVNNYAQAKSNKASKSNKK